MRYAISRTVRSALWCLLFVPLFLYGDNRFDAKGEQNPTRYLKPSSVLDAAIIPECSGIVKSRTYDDLYWVHSDSGHPPSIFPIRSDGTLVQPEMGDTGLSYRGIQLTDAENIDWEDITADGRGNLIIADTGNNRYNRDDLALLVFPEPNPYSDSVVTDIRRIPLRYPEEGRRNRRSGNRRSYDAEALFWLHGSLYLATKQLFGSTRLYRVPSLATETEQELIYIGLYDTDGMVTGADADGDRDMAAFLTYSGIWIFTPQRGTEEEKPGFSHTFRKTHYLPIAAGQCEALCISDDSLIIVNEGGAIFIVPLEEMGL